MSCTNRCRQGRDCSCTCYDKAASAYWLDDDIADTKDWSMAGLWFLAIAAVSCIAGAVVAFASY